MTHLEDVRETDRPQHVGIAVPQTFLGDVQRQRIRDFVRAAEDAGIESLWVQEDVLGPTATLGPIELLAYTAALTRRVRLGVAVLVTPVRNPVFLAKSLATLDQLSDGRLIVGIRLGREGPLDRASGLPASRRLTCFREGLSLMRRLWTEVEVDVDGEFWQLTQARMEPKPRQRPHPPVWIGGGHPRAVRRAVELGDGFVGAGASSTEQFRTNVELVRDALHEFGRDPRRFPISKRVYIAVGPHRAAAGQRLEAWFGAFYGDPGLASQVSVYGDHRECADGLREIVAGGADTLILNPVFDELDQLARLTRDVLPRLG